ncbi:hypothetical protein H6F38_04665 [Paenibacillus sp. EKM208P]|nr:hypothetical protein H6F38_04665 [Paenibacillus sp. EKM208P]
MNEQQKETTAVTVVTKESLNGLSNIEAAYKFYQLIENKDFQTIMEIGNYIKIIAINRKR